jgi:hypothetical protein
VRARLHRYALHAPSAVSLGRAVRTRSHTWHST